MRSMDELEEIRSRLCVVSWSGLQRVAASIGVPFHTLRKIAHGETRNPTYRTFVKLRHLAKTRKRL
jgi:hypothetical protein